MGKVMSKVTITNQYDRWNVEQGTLQADRVRTVTLEALVDTGATTLALPADVVAALGLPEINRRRVRMANGAVEELAVVGGFMLEILGRTGMCEAFVLPAGTTPLIGQVPLEILDLIVDPKSREVTVNPASPDAPLLDLLRAS
ncbi:MAG TPA: retroviral-like aspartic protease family protein [Polyangiaceae bacterium]|jgi:clan AA aspartic protease|nr:retroviral-like aspartic protease family protein [Polyangiaceae bacterium]